MALEPLSSINNNNGLFGKGVLGFAMRHKYVLITATGISLAAGYFLHKYLTSSKSGPSSPTSLSSVPSPEDSVIDGKHILSHRTTKSGEQSTEYSEQVKDSHILRQRPQFHRTGSEQNFNWIREKRKFWANKRKRINKLNIELHSSRVQTEGNEPFNRDSEIEFADYKMWKKNIFGGQLPIDKGRDKNVGNGLKIIKNFVKRKNINQKEYAFQQFLYNYIIFKGKRGNKQLYNDDLNHIKLKIMKATIQKLIITKYATFYQKLKKYKRHKVNI